MRSLLHFILEVIHLPPRYGHLIRMLHSGTDQKITAALASMELTAAQGPVLGFIERSEQPPCARDLEEVFHLSHPTVSGLLTRLEKKGFIQFRPDEADRRCKRIYLLDKGRRCNETMYRIIDENETRMVQDFSPEEQKLFEEFLTRAIRNMGASPCKRKHKEENNP